MSQPAVITLKELSIGYRHGRHSLHEIARNIDVSLHAGELVCLLGPNGAGKSTLIHTICGLQSPLVGSVLLDGKNLSVYSAQELAQRISMVLTQRVDVGMMPVVTLVAMGRYPFTDWAGKLAVRDRQAIHQAMEAVGILSLALRPFCELSDGERQKVMIARALAQEPQVMILDEATAFLDLPHRVELMHLLRTLAHRDGRAILLSTHDLDLALRCADRVWLLPRRGGFRQGVPEDLVLTDSFSEAFADSDVHFDKASGAFLYRTATRGSVGLHGEGIAALWTERALERAGYRIVRAGNAQTWISVETAGERLVWKMQGSDTVRLDSVEALLSHLRQMKLRMEKAGASALKANAIAHDGTLG